MISNFLNSKNFRCGKSSGKMGVRKLSTTTCNISVFGGQDGSPSIASRLMLESFHRKGAAQSLLDHSSTENTHKAQTAHHTATPQPLHIKQQHGVSAMCFQSIRNTSRQGGACGAEFWTLYHMFSITAGKQPPPGDAEYDLSPTSQLLYVGFTIKQAERILTLYASRKRPLDIKNVREWLDLLRQCHVEWPTNALSKHPIMLSNRAENLESRSKETLHRLSRFGLTNVGIGQLLSKWPGLLIVTVGNLEAVEAWLSIELHWSQEQVGKVLAKYSKLFSLTPITLSSKLAWFSSQGCSNAKMGVALFHTPSLFDYTIARNESQLSALQAAGLTPAEVALLIGKRPQLLTRDMSSHITQAKLRYLKEVIGQDVKEMLKFPAYLTCSLVKAVGPRSSFHSLHCSSQPFALNTNLTKTEEHWLRRLSSPSLDAECIARGMTRAQIYKEHTIQWQQGEGKKWNFEKVKPLAGTGADDAPTRDIAMGIEAVDDSTA